MCSTFVLGGDSSRINKCTHATASQAIAHARTRPLRRLEHADAQIGATIVGGALGNRNLLSPLLETSTEEKGPVLEVMAPADLDGWSRALCPRSNEGGVHVVLGARIASVEFLLRRKAASSEMVGS